MRNQFAFVLYKGLPYPSIKTLAGISFYLAFFTQLSPPHLTLAPSLPSPVFPVPLRGSLEPSSFPSAPLLTRVGLSTVSLLKIWVPLLEVFESFPPCTCAYSKKFKNVNQSLHGSEIQFS